MALVPAKCTNCGAQLEVDNIKDAAICPYCQSAYIVQKAINNYNVVNNITADTVNVYENELEDFVIRAGVLEKYNGEAVDVVIPENVYIIGEEAFEECIGLKSVVIPEGVTEIRSRAFCECENLERIEIPGSVTSIGMAAFSLCRKLTEVIFHDGLKEIGISAFANTGLKKVVIPESVEFILGNAFVKCNNLKEVHLPSNPIAISSKSFLDGAFGSCEKLTTIINGEKYYDQCFNDTPYAVARKKAFWKESNRCQYCGGSFVTKGFGIFAPVKVVCGNCLHEKDY